jgi:hypothetical protein
MRVWAFIAAAFVGLVLLLLMGCAGYKLGPTNGTAAGARSVQVAPFENHTKEPRLIDAVNTALRRHLLQDGTFQLDTQGGGDVVLTGAIVKFDRQGVSFQPNDIITIRDYYLTMTARVTAQERGTGKVLFNREVTGRATIRVGNDQTSAERQAVPILADDLARKATALLVDGSW